MDLKECYKFAVENPLCSLATMDGDQPRVRIMLLDAADETGFYFQTGSVKPMYAQLVKNPKAEVCFYKQEGMIGTMLRIAGKVEFVDDKSLKEKVLEERQFLKDFGLTADSPGLIIFKIAHGQAHFWTMENNLKPKEMIEF